MKPTEYHPQIIRILGVIGLCTALFLALQFSARAAPLEDVPQELVQPDGTVIKAFASDDEFYHWVHDANGYVIVRDSQTGYFVYAAKQDGSIVPTEHVVGEVDPAEAGLTPNVMPSPEFYQQRVQAMRPQAEDVTPVPSVADNTGALNNLVVFIRFSDETQFPDPVSIYDSMFNNTAVGANSLRNYYEEASYGQLTVSSTFYPTLGGTIVSYQDYHPRSYYEPFDWLFNWNGYVDASERMNREHALLKNAIDAIASQVPSGLNIDKNSDGYLDSVCFIVRGSPDGWSDLLWPHQWWLFSQTAYVNGKQVATYNFHLESWVKSTTASGGVGVLAHELFHSLGAPDLYHYSLDGLHPVYTWDLMGQNLDPPQHTGAYMKWKYGGWIASVPEITTSGIYTLSPITSAINNAYKIRSPNSATEYFVLEYRRKTGTFESSIPDSGLLVYRVNAIRDGLGNAYGPPDELYMYRPGRDRDGQRHAGQCELQHRSGKNHHHRWHRPIRVSV